MTEPKKIYVQVTHERYITLSQNDVIDIVTEYLKEKGHLGDYTFKLDIRNFTMCFTQQVRD